MTRHATRPERGAAAVEFALVVPILVMLLFGIATTGLTYTNAVGLTNAVREGARLGATADASTTVEVAWADNVIQRVRDTQFDDPSRETRICVQLWKIGTGQVGATGKCSTEGIPPLTLPATAAAAPAVPATPIGSCVVRVIAARPFTINIGVNQWDEVHETSSIARYERKDMLPSCL